MAEKEPRLSKISKMHYGKLVQRGSIFLAALAVYVLHLELMGTWIFGLSEIALRFAFFYPRFASGKWKDKKV